MFLHMQYIVHHASYIEWHMKIRIKGNTVRYRLSKPEVAALAEEGILEERTEFINGTLVYAIKETKGGTLSADFTQHTITLHVPQTALQTWAETEQTGIDHYMPLPNGSTLYLLLEKDFKCIDTPVTEDQSDYFENPHLTC